MCADLSFSMAGNANYRRLYDVLTTDDAATISDDCVFVRIQKDALGQRYDKDT